MSGTCNTEIDPGQPVIYQIRLKGHLGRHWTDWFDGLTITLEDNGETLLTGPVVDQAALHGLLRKVRDLGMPLLSIMPRDNRPDGDHDKGEIACQRLHWNVRLITRASVHTRIACRKRVPAPPRTAKPRQPS